MPAVSKQHPAPVQIYLNGEVHAAQFLGENKLLDIAYVRIDGQNHTTRVTCDCIAPVSNQRGAIYA